MESDISQQHNNEPSLPPEPQVLAPTKSSQIIRVIIILAAIILVGLIAFLMIGKIKKDTTQNRLPAKAENSLPTKISEKSKLKVTPTVALDSVPLPSLGATNSEFVKYFQGDGVKFIKYFDEVSAFIDQQPTQQACKFFSENDISKLKSQEAIIIALSKIPGINSSFNITHNTAVSFYSSANRFINGCVAGADKKLLDEELRVINANRTILNRIFKQTGFR